MYDKESDNLTRRTFDEINNEINNVQYMTILLADESKAKVYLTAHPTMMDGKCLNVLLKNKATQRCQGCLETNKGYLKD